MSSAARIFRSVHQKNIVQLFEGMSVRHSRWQIWQDWIVMSAIAVSNVCDSAHREKREETYRTLSSKYTESEMNVFSQMFAEMVQGMDVNTNQDFLGELFMGLELGNDHAGQFFTPYCICSAMAKLNAPDIPERVEEKGWIGVSDPACGAGALLVAFANECLEREINYQTSVLFVAQDIDFVVGCMCYLQLSILGCAGYVVIADSLRYPSVSYDSKGLIPVEDDNRDIWYTPFYFRTEWQMRRFAASMDILSGSKSEKQEEHIADAGKKVEEQVEKPAPLPEPAKEEINQENEQTVFNMTATGQLTLF